MQLVIEVKRARSFQDNKNVWGPFQQDKGSSLGSPKLVAHKRPGLLNGSEPQSGKPDPIHAKPIQRQFKKLRDCQPLPYEMPRTNVVLIPRCCSAEIGKTDTSEMRVTYKISILLGDSNRILQREHLPFPGCSMIHTDPVPNDYHLQPEQSGW